MGSIKGFKNVNLTLALTDDLKADNAGYNSVIPITKVAGAKLDQARKDLAVLVKDALKAKADAKNTIAKSNSLKDKVAAQAGALGVPVNSIGGYSDILKNISDLTKLADSITI